MIKHTKILFITLGLTLAIGCEDKLSHHVPDKLVRIEDIDDKSTLSNQDVKCCDKSIDWTYYRGDWRQGFDVVRISSFRTSFVIVGNKYLEFNASENEIGELMRVLSEFKYADLGSKYDVPNVADGMYFVMQLIVGGDRKMVQSHIFLPSDAHQIDKYLDDKYFKKLTGKVASDGVDVPFSETHPRIEEFYGKDKVSDININDTDASP